jgi:competence protein ComEC
MLVAERDRWALWLPVAFAIGIGVYFALAVEPPLWVGLSSVLAALSLLLALRRVPSGPAIGLLGLALAAGFLAAQARSGSVEAPVLAKRIGPVWVSGEIEILEPRAKGARITLRRPEIARLEPDQTPARVRIVVPAAGPDLQPGEWVRLRAVLRPPPGPSAPGAFDFARQAYFQRLGAVGFAYGGVRPDLRPGALDRPIAAPFKAWSTAWAGLRAKLARSIMAALPGRAGAVAAALMTGERGAIP